MSPSCIAIFSGSVCILGTMPEFVNIDRIAALQSDVVNVVRHIVQLVIETVNTFAKYLWQLFWGLNGYS